MIPDGAASPEVRRLLDRLAHDLPGAFPSIWIGLYLYGSLVTGDFDPARSDLDLLAVLTDDPTEDDLARLRDLHVRIDEDEPAWRGRIEVAYVSRPALAAFRTGARPMVRISPGEPLHVVAATRHYLLGWYLARQGVALSGPPPEQAIPPIDHAEFLEVVRQHARQWTSWVHDTGGPDGQAYAVLTLCRALYTATTGEQTSKPRAARWTQERMPAWSALIAWALSRHDAASAGSANRDHLEEVVHFVEHMSARVEDVFKTREA